MKLASLKQGRDGKLVVVSRDLKRMLDVSAIAPTLQGALDNWAAVAPRLQEQFDALEAGKVEGQRFDEKAVAAPFPRGYQFLDASAYVNHVALVRQARKTTMPESFWTDPLMYQGSSDAFLGPRDPIEFLDEEGGIDFEGEICIVVGDVPMNPSREVAAASIRLFLLMNDISLRVTLAKEIEKQLGFVHAKPPSALSPVAVTPDELGDAWDGGLLHLPLRSELNGKLFGQPNAGIDMTFDFPRLVQHAAATRRLSAGTIIGSGTVSNRDQSGGPGKPIGEGGVGYSCIVEIRTVETIRNGKPSTNFMKFGDRIALEMLDKNGASIFGRIDQEVKRYRG